MEKIKAPKFKLVYGSKDITKDVSQYYTSITYTDAEKGESDEITIELEDTDGLWIDAWYPQKRDTLKLSIGYDDTLLPCGEFTIDEIEINFSRDSGTTLTIKALAAGVTSKIRTRRSTAHEKTTLRQIAQKIAAANGFTVTGEIENITFERITQYRESDLGFLNRLAREYGYNFSIKGKQLVFTSVNKLENGKQALSLDVEDLISARITDKSVGTAKEANAKYRNPQTNEVIQTTSKANEKGDDGIAIGGEKTAVTAEDALELRSRVENEAQARAKAQSALHQANSKEQEGFFSLYGEPRAMAGVNIELTGLGKNSGRWHIAKSTHRIDRSGGYLTELEAFRLKDEPKAEKRRPKRRKIKRKPASPKFAGGGGGGYGDRSLITQSD